MVLLGRSWRMGCEGREDMFHDEEGEFAPTMMLSLFLFFFFGFDV
jgi:hypothetical protein